MKHRFATTVCLLAILTLLVVPSGSLSFARTAQQGNSERLVQVQATADWVNTGVSLGGETVTIEYVSGRWRTWTYPNEDWDGRGCLYCTIPYPPHDLYTPLKTARHGSLIGRIGNGQMFAVGNAATVDTASTGERGTLYLRINDTRQSDNSGAITVRVRVGSSSAIPAPPSNLRVTGASTTGIALAWQDNSNNEDGFVIYRWNGSIFDIVGNVGPNATSFTDTGLGCDTGYSYEVSAQNGAGKSSRVGTQGRTAACAPQSTVPTPPNNVRVTGVTQTSVTLAWQDGSNNERGFYIYRWGGRSWDRVGSVGADATSFTENNLNCDTAYSYQASAYNDVGESQRVQAADIRTSTCIATRLPIVLVHGWEGPDLKLANPFIDTDPDAYFDRIGEMLEKDSGGRYRVFYAKLETSPRSTPRIDTNMPNLIRAIDEAKRITGQGQVILIGHSMGGLLSTMYVEGDQYRNDVSQLFTFGTMHLGVNISSNWYGIVGAPLGMSVADFVFKQQVMEDFKYDARVRFVRDHPRRAGVIYHLINGSVSAEAISGPMRLLAETFGAVANDGAVPTRSGLGLPGTIDRLNIPGINHGGYFAKDSPGRQCLRRVLIDGQANCGTVSTVTDDSLPAANPRCNAGDFIAILKTYNIGKRQINALAQFASDCKTKGIRAFELAKEAAKQGLQVGYAAIRLPGTVLAATVASQSARYSAMTSPATIMVTTGSGQRAGVLNDGSIVQEIPDSQVLVIGDEQYIFYPPTAAVVSLRGTGSGTMSIEAVNADGGATSQAVAYQNVMISPGLAAQVSTSDPQANLNIDSNGDGRVDQTRAPDTSESLGSPISPPGSGNYSFPQTGFSVSGRFWELWQGGRSFNDSLYINGFPITSLQAERSDTDGKVYQTQWFERARFEMHPEKAAPYDVLLGLLGTNSVAGRQNEDPFKPVSSPGGNLVWFQETRHTLGDDSEGGRAIATYWNRLGGLPQFGFPLSQPFFEWNQTENKSYLVQYFERQRFEYHPENKGTRYEVLLGLLGSENYSFRNFGPSSGQLLHTGDKEQYLARAGTRIKDFQASAKFYSPFDAKVHSWDVAMQFRHPNNSSFCEVIIWVNAGGTSWAESCSQGSSQRTIKSGQLSNWDSSASGANTLSIEAQDARGVLYINGQRIADLDLSAAMQAGDIIIMTGRASSDWVPGSSTRYDSFTVRPLP